MKNAGQKTQKKRMTGRTVIQTLYFTGVFFFSNDLFAYASACTFGFLFSFIPVVMMILIILIRVLHASPDMLQQLFGGNEQIMRFLNLDSVAKTISEIKTITNFEIVIGIAIIFMARRFFSSIINSVNRIFHAQIKSRPLISQLIVFAGEAILIVGTSIVIFLFTTARAITRYPIFSKIIPIPPVLLSAMTDQMLNTLPYLLVFVIVLICYKGASRSKPPLKICAVSSLLCVISFVAVQKLMGHFINLNNYNIVYGVLSNTIVLLLEAFFFFTIFLFFAEMVFVRQYFDSLLMGELYLLPDRDDTSRIATIKRLLFIRPDSLLKNSGSVMTVPKGGKIYSRGERGQYTYFIANGSVLITRTNNLSYLDAGSFFGEEACLLDEIRNEDATAYTDVKLLRIPEEDFFTLLEKNPSANNKALSKISKYFARFYKPTTDLPLFS
ncbi:MAG: YihY/virulence factor BrkB family protein [Treponema sp.]|nr:YihY/virulence factor BrkB family protein [Treponema sp.]